MRSDAVPVGRLRRIRFQLCASAAHRKALVETKADAQCSCAETQTLFFILDAARFGAPKRDLLGILSVDAETNLAAPGQTYHMCLTRFRFQETHGKQQAGASWTVTAT